MKFAQKMVLTVVIILVLSLSLMMFLTIDRNFQVNVEKAVSDYLTQHLLGRYSLEKELIALRQRLGDNREEALRGQAELLTQYIGSEGYWQALVGSDGKLIFSAMPSTLSDDVLARVALVDGAGYLIHKEQSEYVLFITSTIQSGNSFLRMISAYEVTSLYAERSRQLNDMIKMDALILLVAMIAIVLASKKLTKPIRQLNKTSRKIANGAYEARTDITSEDEIGELGVTFNRMASAVENQMEQLNLSLQQREDFVCAFTHEVKTPMTAIIGYSDILRFQETTPTVRQDAAQFIYREATRLESLSQKLLLLMGLSEEKITQKAIDLNTIFRDAVRSCLPVLEENDIEVRCKQVGTLFVLADHDLIVDLLRNLILNAIKAQPKDKIIRIGCKQNASKCTLAVSDTGKGIPASELLRMKNCKFNCPTKTPVNIKLPFGQRTYIQKSFLGSY